ncbi:MAG TPA: alpha-ketoglutarate-dependent dioxygenase AlkB [Methylomirabilota bacterium]|jgi:alkylated DNA repair dioxygenase AlkB|nr:alpha-ketoglutarate-dependent dioxygenase AlkB [Methylomirabilota bacterium]
MAQPRIPYGINSEEHGDSLALALPDASLVLWETFLPKTEADALFTALLQDTPWRQEMMRMYGKAHPLPRLTAWYGDPGARYRYSGIVNEPLPWTPVLAAVRGRIQAWTGHAFNSVLLNLYRSGTDSLSWHQDNEPELGEAPVIASLSLGQVRLFQLRHRFRKDLPRVDLPLPHGSLLLMKGGTQQYWQHRIPKTSQRVDARLNVTFRTIMP